MVVVEGRGGSDYEPGLYRRGSDGSWERLFSGKILLDPASGRLKANLEMGVHTGRFESLGIVDGHLRLFSSRGQSDKGEGLNDLPYIDIGSEAVPIRDPLTGFDYQLPPITSWNDIDVRTAFFENHQIQVVIVTLKLTAFPVSGVKGITYAFALHMKAAHGEKIRLMGPPVILSFQKEPADKLTALALDKNDGVGFFSREWAKKLSQATPTDPLALKEWRNDVKDWMSLELPPGYELEELSTIPHISLKTGEPVLLEVPRYEEDNDYFNLVTLFDPELAMHKSVLPSQLKKNISLKDLRRVVPFSDGYFMFDESGAYDAIHALDFHTAKYTALRDSGGRYWLLTKGVDPSEKRSRVAASKGEIVDKVEIKPPKPLRGAIVELSALAEPTTGTLITSWKSDAGDGLTAIHSLSLKYPPRILSEMAIADEFYHQESLGWRVHTFQSDESGSKQIVGFDISASPEILSHDDYIAQYREVAAQVDLQSTLKTSELQLYFPEPSREIDFGSSVIYREYQATEANPELAFRRSGFYIGKKPSADSQTLEPRPKEPRVKSQFINGKIVQLPQIQTDSEAMQLWSKHISMEAEKGPSRKMALSGYAFETSSSLRGYGSLLLVASSDDHASGLVINSRSLSKDFSGKLMPFSKLLHFSVVDVLPPSDKNKGHGVVSVVMTLQAVGTVLMQVPIRFSEGKFQINQEYQECLLTQDLLSPDEVWGRMRRFTNDQLAFILTPELAEDDPKFTVKRVYDSTEHSVGGRGRMLLKPVHDSSLHEPMDGGSWLVRESDSRSDEERSRRDRLRHSAEYAVDFMTDFRWALEAAAKKGSKSRRVVFLISPSMRRYAVDYPIALYLRHRSSDTFVQSDDGWSLANRNLKIMNIPSAPQMPQEDVLSNFEHMRRLLAIGKRPIVVSSLEAINSISEPKVPATLGREGGGELKGFVLKDSNVIQGTDVLSTAAVSESTSVPHMLYWLATEGRPIPLNEFRPESLESTIPTILIGTAAEWRMLSEGRTGPEWKQGLADAFEVVEVPPPTAERRAEYILRNVFQIPQINELNYQVDLSTFGSSVALHDKDPFLVVAEYLVNRAEDLAANQFQLDVFESFLKVAARLSSELTQNWDLRRQRKIDRFFIERCLVQVFPMSLSREILAEGDPLTKVFQPDFLRRWSTTKERRYYGQLPFKMRTQQILQGMVLPSEGHNIPASIIIVGSKGTGKTTGVRALFEGVFGLKEWKMGPPASEDRGPLPYLYISLESVVNPRAERSNKGQESIAANQISLEKLNETIDQMLSSPNGWRSVFVFDDIHVADESVRAAILKRIRQLQNSKTMPVKNAQGKIEEVSTRNLVIVLITNLQDNPEKLKKYVSQGRLPTLEQRLLATFAGADFEPESSFINRFGDVINYSGYEPDSMGPKLREEIVRTAKMQLTSALTMRITDPTVIDEIVRKFRGLNGRDFSTSSGRGFASLYRDIQSPFSIVIPKSLGEGPLNVKPGETAAGVGSAYSFRGSQQPFSWDDASSSESATQLEQFIASQFQVIPISAENLEGRFNFLLYMLGNMRKKAFLTLATGVMEDDQVQSDIPNQRFLLMPLVRGMRRHLKDFAEAPADQLLQLDYQKLGAVSPNHYSMIRGRLRRIAETRSISFPKFTRPEATSTGLVSGDRINRLYQLTEATVMNHTLDQLQEWSTDFAYFMIRRKRTQSRDEWFQQLHRADSLSFDIESQKKKMMQIYLKFTRSLGEIRASQVASEFSQYDVARLFIILLDQAIHKVNWATISNEGVALIKRATDDLAFAQLPSLQELLFDTADREDRWTAFLPVDTNSVLGQLENVPMINEDQVAEQKQHERFTDRCSDWMVRIGSAS